MRCQIKVAAMLFCLLGTDFAWGQSYQQQTFPLYRGLFSAAGMYRMPAGNYASVVEPGPGLGLQFHWNPLFFNGFLLQFNAGLSDHKIINSDNSRYLLATGTLGPVFDLPLAWGSELHLSGGASAESLSSSLLSLSCALSSSMDPLCAGDARSAALASLSAFRSSPLAPALALHVLSSPSISVDLHLSFYAAQVLLFFGTPKVFFSLAPQAQHRLLQATHAALHETFAEHHPAT